jgi:hypothetical protein
MANEGFGSAIAFKSLPFELPEETFLVKMVRKEGYKQGDDVDWSRL